MNLALNKPKYAFYPENYPEKQSAKYGTFFYRDENGKEFEVTEAGDLHYSSSLSDDLIKLLQRHSIMFG